MIALNLKLMPPAMGSYLVEVNGIRCIYVATGCNLLAVTV